MRVLIQRFAVLSILFSAVACQKNSDSREVPETLVMSYDEAAMDKAVAKAQSSVGEFFAVLQLGDADSFSVKVAITDNDQTEHFWLNKLGFQDGSFTGVLANEPGIVTNVSMGQEWKVKMGEISDWMYERGDKIHGGFTIDPLLDTLPEEEAEAMRGRLVR